MVYCHNNAITCNLLHHFFSDSLNGSQEFSYEVLTSTGLIWHATVYITSMKIMDVTVALPSGITSNKHKRLRKNQMALILCSLLKAILVWCVKGVKNSLFACWDYTGAEIQERNCDWSEEDRATNGITKQLKKEKEMKIPSLIELFIRQSCNKFAGSKLSHMNVWCYSLLVLNLFNLNVCTKFKSQVTH